MFCQAVDPLTIYGTVDIVVIREARDSNSGSSWDFYK